MRLVIRPTDFLMNMSGKRLSKRLAQKAAVDPSSLASVVVVKTWLKVRDDHPLALFFTKFWGKSMEAEEGEWQKAEADGHEAMAEEEDNGEATYKKDDEAILEGEDETLGEMDEEAIDVDKDEGEDEGDKDAIDMDKGEVEDEDDDVTPGCYVLDIGIHGIVPSRLWIRSDYVRIYDALQDFYEEVVNPDNRAPSAVVTGQPGIGESGFA